MIIIQSTVQKLFIKLVFTVFIPNVIILEVKLFQVETLNLNCILQTASFKRSINCGIGKRKAFPFRLIASRYLGIEKVVLCNWLISGH